LAVAVDAGTVRVETENLPAVIIGEHALLLLDVLEIRELIDTGEQPVEFLLYLAGASFDIRGPWKFVGIEEFGTPGRCACNEPLKEGSPPPGDRVSDLPPRHRCSLPSATAVQIGYWSAAAHSADDHLMLKVAHAVDGWMADRFASDARTVNHPAAQP
jgi:hypothetical protein